MKEYKISLYRSKQTIIHKNDISLLENLEINGISHEYQCRSGYCGSCRATMIKGKVSYKELPLAFVQQNEILLCCCQAEEDLEIDL